MAHLVATEDVSAPRGPAERTLTPAAPRATFALPYAGSVDWRLGMKCPRCQQENPPQAKFCLECATPLAPRCTNCGTQLPAGAKFCFECATPVSAPGFHELMRRRP